VLLLLVLIGLLIISFVVFRQRRRHYGAQEKLLERIAVRTHTMPKPGDDGVRGKYKGYLIETTSRLWIGSTRQEDEARQAVDKSQKRWSSFNPKLVVELKSPNANYPAIAIWDDLSWLPTGVLLPEERRQRMPAQPKMALDTTPLHPRVSLYGADVKAARLLLESAELRHQLKNWHFVDLRAEGDTIRLRLDSPLAWEKFGNRLKHPQYIIAAMDLCVEMAEVLKAYVTEHV
jgi:hypothetical protein